MPATWTKNQLAWLVGFTVRFFTMCRGVSRGALVTDAVPDGVALSVSNGIGIRQPGMHTDGPRAVGPHGKPVEASASTTASDVGAMRGSASQYLNTCIRAPSEHN